jgi:hypothetical protein
MKIRSQSTDNLPYTPSTFYIFDFVFQLYFTCNNYCFRKQLEYENSSREDQIEQLENKLKVNVTCRVLKISNKITDFSLSKGTVFK